MTTWWKEQGWPWLKDNGWMIFIAPLALVVFVSMWSMRKLRDPIRIIDPLSEANRRDLEVLAKKNEALVDERQKLHDELAELTERYTTLRERLDSVLENEVDELRNAPDKLLELMRSL